MTSQQLALLAPFDSALPPVPEGDVLTPEQWTTLFAIADTYIPSVKSASSKPCDDCLSVEDDEYAAATGAIEAISPAGKDDVRAYFEEKFSDTPGVRETFQRTFSQYTRQESMRGISMILSALNTRAGCLVMTGSMTPFHQQPVNVRQQIITGWRASYLTPLRGIAKIFGLLTTSVWHKNSLTFSKVLGFPRTPVHWTQGNGFDYHFLQFPPGDGPETVETDVVIVGSGCGGGVCAKNLAEAGQRVLVTERAYHFSTKHLPMSEKEGSVHLFQNGGIELSDDASIGVIAGRAWGGGGTVNWSASLQTQEYVRQEWAEGGLPFFTSSEFQTCLDRVCDRMGVGTEAIKHNKANQVLLEGARKLGYNGKPVPQNTAGKQHYCGYCTEGCGAAEKQGPVVSWLPDAARAGANFMEGFEADKIIFETIDGKKTAVGVEGMWISRDSNGGVSGPLVDRVQRRLIIKAKRVIVSGGTLSSPLLLLRSGLTNPQIGRHLHLHPVSGFAATFPETVNPWEGGILTAVVDSLQNQDGHGHGVKLEAVCMLPTFLLPLLPVSSGLELKQRAATYKNMVGFISLARDRDWGRVYPDPVDGKTRVQYSPSPFDRKHMLEGVVALAKIAYVCGATELITTIAGVPVFKRDAPPATEAAASPDSIPSDQGINDPAFQAWLAALRRKGMPSPDAGFGTAHQMGTCRMAAAERDGVVDPSGKVWGTEGLYVADASVFPSASGVNPMVTTMAIADWISRGIGRGLRREGAKL